MRPFACKRRRGGAPDARGGSRDDDRQAAHGALVADLIDRTQVAHAQALEEGAVHRDGRGAQVLLQGDGHFVVVRFGSWAGAREEAGVREREELASPLLEQPRFRDEQTRGDQERERERKERACWFQLGGCVWWRGAKGGGGGKEEEERVPPTPTPTASSPIDQELDGPPLSLSIKINRDAQPTPILPPPGGAPGPPARAPGGRRREERSVSSSHSPPPPPASPRDRGGSFLFFSLRRASRSSINTRSTP